MFPPSPETSSEQMSSEAFQQLCDACFARRRRRLPCPARRTARRARRVSQPHWTAKSLLRERIAMQQTTREDSSGCRSRPASTRNMALGAAAARGRQGTPGDARCRGRRRRWWRLCVEAQKVGWGDGGGWQGETWQVAGWPLALHQIVGSVASAPIKTRDAAQ
jgi:hypothetical protein